MAEEEAMFAGKPHADKHDSRGRDGCLLDVGRRGRLYYLMGDMAYGAVRMCQPIRMKVRLLNGSAYEQKDGAHDREQKASAHSGCSILPHFSHH